MLGSSGSSASAGPLVRSLSVMAGPRPTIWSTLPGREPPSMSSGGGGPAALSTWARPQPPRANRPGGPRGARTDGHRAPDSRPARRTLGLSLPTHPRGPAGERGVKWEELGPASRLPAQLAPCPRPTFTPSQSATEPSAPPASRVWRGRREVSAAATTEAGGACGSMHQDGEWATQSGTEAAHAPEQGQSHRQPEGPRARAHARVRARAYLCA